MIGPMPQPHISVLRSRVVEHLVTRPGGAYLDGTVGAGGHAEAILQAAGPTATLLGLDADPAALELAEERLRPFDQRARLVHSNFRHMATVAAATELGPFTGILLDLGLSSMQLDSDTRGFSFRAYSPLDMRFDPTSPRRASRLVNDLTEADLIKLLRDYGEEPFAQPIARTIIAARPLRSTADLSAAVTEAVPARALQGSLPRVFQALRIAVNQELEALAEGLEQAEDLLAGGGRLAVISFHSLEDRIVKRFFGDRLGRCTCPPGLPQCVCGAVAHFKLVTRRPISPSEEEVRVNPRARSAKLRVAEKL